MKDGVWLYAGLQCSALHRSQFYRKILTARWQHQMYQDFLMILLK